MFVKGQPRTPGSGRKKGTANKKTIQRREQEAQEAEEQANEMPADYMLRIMRDPKADPGRRDVMARAAAPYCHPQLQAVAHRLLHADGPGAAF
jgi:hypothetical protein